MSTPCKPLREEIQQRLDLGRQVVPRRVDGVDVCGAADPRGEEAFQVAVAQVGGHVPFGAQDDAVAGLGPFDSDLAKVGGEGAAHFDHELFVAVGELPVVVRGGGFADDDAAVAGELARGVGAAVGVQIGGRGADEAAVGGQTAGLDAGVGRRAEADAHVEGVFGEVEGAVGEFEDDFHVGIAAGEVGQGRGQMAAPEAEGGVDAEQAAGRFAAAAQGAFEGVQVLQDLFAAVEVAAAFRGQADAARGAIEEAHAEALLQRGEAAADAGGGDAQRLGRGGQGGLARQQAEEGEVGQIVHSCVRGNSELVCEGL